jgi:hypothetical protein
LRLAFAARQAEVQRQERDGNSEHRIAEKDQAL